MPLNWTRAEFNNNNSRLTYKRRNWRNCSAKERILKSGREEPFESAPIPGPCVPEKNVSGQHNTTSHDQPLLDNDHDNVDDDAIPWR